MAEEKDPEVTSSQRHPKITNVSEKLALRMT